MIQHTSSICAALQNIKARVAKTADTVKTELDFDSIQQKNPTLNLSLPPKSLPQEPSLVQSFSFCFV